MDPDLGLRSWVIEFDSLTERMSKKKKLPKTGFDQYLEKQMKNPVFAKAYKKASKEIDKIVRKEKKKLS